MGALDRIVNCVVTYKADTKDMKAGLKELQGEERKLAEARLKSAETSNRGIEKQIATIGKWTVALGTIGVAAKVAFDALEHSGRKADLSAVAAGISIDGLRKATFGLKTNMELLEFAAKTNQGQFKLNQGQMETVAKAMVALEERGNDSAQVFDALTTALVTGKTKGLAPFGIQVDETKDKAAKFKDIMSQLSKVSGEVSESSLDAADKMTQQKVAFANIFDTVQDGIGKVAEAMLPYVQLLAQVAGFVADIASHIPNIPGLGGGGVGSKIAKATSYLMPGIGQLKGAHDAYRYFNPEEADGTWGDAFGRARGKAANRPRPDAPDLDMPAMYVGSDLARKKKSGSGKAKDPWEGWSDFAGFGNVGSTFSENIGDADASTRAMMEIFQKAAAKYQDEQANPQRLALAAREMKEILAEQDTAKKESFLSSTFGPVGEFDIYAQAFSALSGAVGSAFSAWIDGSASAGQAFKAFAGEAVKSIAIQMAMEAMKEGAYALAALAWGNIPKATLHGQAALQFAAGTVIAGGVAKAMSPGSGGASAGRGASPGAPQNYGSQGGGSQGVHNTIVYGDSFADDSPRQRQLRAERVVNKVIGTSGVVYA